MLSVAIVYVLGRLLFDHRLAWWGTALFAVSPAAILDAIEIRGYALMVLLVLLSNLALLRAVRSGKLRYWFLFASGGTLAMAAHLFGGLFFVPAFLFIALRFIYSPAQRRELGRGALLALFVIGVGTALLAGLMLQSGATRANFEQVWTDHLESDFTGFNPENLSETFTPYLEPLRRANFTDATDWRLGLYGVVVLIGVTAGLAHKQHRPAMGYLVLVALAPLVAVTIAQTILGPNFRAFPRYFDFALFAYIFAAGYAISWLSRLLARGSRLAQMGLAGLLLLLIASPAYAQLSPLYIQGQSQQLMALTRYLRQRVAPTDLILCVARDNEATKLIRDRCLVSLNFAPELTGHASSWQELSNHRIWQNLIIPGRDCNFDYVHVPHVRLNPVCTEGRPNKSHVWLIFWQQGAPAAPYRWDSPLLDSQWGQTRLLHLAQSDHLAENLKTAADLILKDQAPPQRAASNILTLAHMLAGLGDLAQANGALDKLPTIEASPDMLGQAEALRQQLPYLDGPAWPETRLQASWGQQIQLLGYTLQEQPGSATAHNLKVTLFWQALQTPNQDYTFFLHWRDANNATLSQIDFRPYDGLWPTSRWMPGEIVRESRTLPLPDTPAAGNLVLGIYDVNTLERLPLENDVSHENVLQLP